MPPRTEGPTIHERANGLAERRAGEFRRSLKPREALRSARVAGALSALAVNQIQCPPSVEGLASLLPPCCSRITPTRHRIPGSLTDLRDHMPFDTVLAVCYVTNWPYSMLHPPVG